MGVHPGLIAEASDILPDLIALRRAIHAEPELGLQTPKTTARIMAALKGFPLAYRTGPSTTGVVAILEGRAPGRTVLLRGDMDALPLTEDTGASFSSKIPGVMHACGHDSHAAMLVGAARLLSARRAGFDGTILFMFQPGEEGWHGARHMLDDGLLDPLPEAAFALHIMPNAPHGVFTGKSGPLMASADRVFIDIIGKGGHASMPHDAVDPVPVACEIVMAIQSFVTRQVNVFDPAVVTIGKIEAGTTDNVIPETATLTGTIRTLSPERRAMVAGGLKDLAENIARAHGAKATVRVVEGFPVTRCDPRAVELGRGTVKGLYGPGEWIDMATPVMGAEDFSYVLDKVPGAMFFLGASKIGSDWRASCACHSNRMVMDEAVMARGAAVHAALAERFLAEGFSGA